MYDGWGFVSGDWVSAGCGAAADFYSFVPISLSTSVLQCHKCDTCTDLCFISHGGFVLVSGVSAN